MQNHGHDEQARRDARLTDYLCGELDGAGAQALEAELQRDAELRARLEELRRAFAWVRDEAPPPPAQLGEARRVALRAAAAELAAAQAAARDGHFGAAAPPRATRVLRFPLWARAAAGLAVVAGLIALWRGPLGPVQFDAAASAPASHVGAADLSEMGYVSGTADRTAGFKLEALGYGGGAAFEPGQALRPWTDEQLTHLGGFVGRLETQPGADAGVMQFHLGPADTILPSVSPPSPPVSGGLEAPAAPGGAAPPTERRAGGEEEGRAKDKDAARGLLALESLADSEPDLQGNAGLALRGGGGGSPYCELTDGYGRRFINRGVVDHLRRHGNESPRDMFFRYYGDNAAVRAADDPLSTFAADVDTASYALVRAYVTQGSLPPKAAVRTEECVNSFRQELAAPREDDFALTLEAAPTPFAGEESLLLRCGLKAREVTRAERKPLNLVFVVDKSGSMEQGQRLELVRGALELLVDQVRDDDTIGLVAFDSKGHEILAPTPGAERWKIREALRSIQPGGSTNAAAGLFLGYAMAERAFRAEAVNRVVLASDGVANTGETDQARILEQIRRRAEADVDLTTIGVGMGNHNDAFLERMANEAEGTCHYVDSLEEAKRVFVDGFTGAMQVVAREARVQVEFDPSTVREWRQIGYENRALADRDFRNDRVDAGEIGAGHEMVALYEVVLAPGADRAATLATLRLRWKPDGARAFVEREARLRLGQVRTRWEEASPRLRLNGAVAQFAEFLRRSVHARGEDYGRLRAEADRLAREFARDPQVAEFFDLVGRAEQLARQAWPEDELSLLIDEARRARLIECELESAPQRDARAEELLREVRLQNAELERKLGEILERPR